MTDIESCREVCIRVPTRPKECGVTTAGGGRERERERPRQRQKRDHERRLHLAARSTESRINRLLSCCLKVSVEGIALYPSGAMANHSCDPSCLT